jgi:hypothetical protein
MSPGQSWLGKPDNSTGSVLPGQTLAIVNQIVAFSGPSGMPKVLG